MDPLKFVIVGDVGVGKSSIQWTVETGAFYGEYIPGTLELTVNKAEVDENPYSFVIWDTAGGEDYDRLRPIAYPKTDVFIICFSLVNSVSFENIKLKWLPEVRMYCPDTPIIILGNKLDLRNQQLPTLIVKERKKLIEQCISNGQAFAKEIGAVKYLECSALTQEGLKEVFHEAIKTIFKTQKELNCHCQLI